MNPFYCAACPCLWVYAEWCATTVVVLFCCYHFHYIVLVTIMCDFLTCLATTIRAMTWTCCCCWWWWWQKESYKDLHKVKRNEKGQSWWWCGWRWRHLYGRRMMHHAWCWRWWYVCRLVIIIKWVYVCNVEQKGGEKKVGRGWSQVRSYKTDKQKDKLKYMTSSN